MNKESLSKNEWFTPQECAGLPGFPTAVANVRNRLNELSDGLNGVKRQRAASKAFEYHVSILPQVTRDYLGYADDVSLPARQKRHTRTSTDNTRDMWELIYSGLTQEQRDAVLDVFMVGGLKLLMPAVLELSNIDSTKRREILQQRLSVESALPAPGLSTHGKKAG